jgi:hypothetical protein
MSLEPITGFNIINNILKIFKIQIPIDVNIFKMGDFLTKPVTEKNTSDGKNDKFIYGACSM